MSDREVSGRQLRQALEQFNQKMLEFNTVLMREALIGFFRYASYLYLINDKDGNLVLINAAWKQALGWELSELYQMQFWELIHPDDLQASTEEFTKSRTEEKETSGFRNRYRHKAGHYVTLEWFGNTSSSSKYGFGVARVVG